MKRSLLSVFIVIFIIFPIIAVHMACATELKLIYDANGNLMTGDGKYRIYDDFNHLAQIYNGSDSTGTLLESYVYHPTEERILIKKLYNSDGSLKETTYYFSKNAVQISNSSGVYNFTYVYLGDRLIGQSVNGQTLFMHTDAQSSVRVVTNNSGVVLENSSFEPFGLSTAGSNLSRYGYTGKEADSIVGDYDYGARKYRSDLGMYMQPDPSAHDLRYSSVYQQRIYNPQELNAYSYVLNNPYRFIDPTGLWAVLYTASAGAGAGYMISASLSFGVSHSQESGWQIGFVGSESKGWGVIGSLAASPIGVTYSKNARNFNDLYGDSKTVGGSVGVEMIGGLLEKSRSFSNPDIVSYTAGWAPGFSYETHSFDTHSEGGFLSLGGTSLRITTSNGVKTSVDKIIKTSTTTALISKTHQSSYASVRQILSSRHK